MKQSRFTDSQIMAILKQAPQCQHSCRILLKAIFIDESLQPCRKTRSRAQDIAP